MEHAKIWREKWWLVLTLGLWMAACNRAQVDRDVNELKQTGNDVEATVRKTVEGAKAGADRVRDKLPAATERARDELVAAGNEVKETLKAAGEKVREDVGGNRERERNDKDEPKQP